MFKQSPKINLNYAASIVKLNNIRKHPNADKLKITTIQGNDVITGAPLEVGQICIYFPLECTISKSYLSYSNSFEKKEDNRNPQIKGFFGKHGRVRAVKLRGTPSVGYIVPVSSLQEWLEHKKGVKLSIDWEKLVGTEFDYYDDIFICKKYTSVQERNEKQKTDRVQKKNEKVVKESKLVENQFKLHKDTPALGKTVSTIYPDDIISITFKKHGSSGCFSNVLTTKKLKWYEKLLIKLGVNVVQTVYGNLFSSRKIIKNKWHDEEQNKKIVQSGYYKVDLWGAVNETLKEYLEEGMTLYGEIVGYLPKCNTYIQKDYDYGCKEGEFKFYIYRITTTTPNGNVIEWDMNSIQQWAKQKGLLAVPLYYYGAASQLFKDLDNSPNNEEELAEWQNQFLQKLKDAYLEGDDPYCTKAVPAEGIVLRKEGVTWDARKLKSWNFLNMESAQLDLGEVTIEDEQSLI